MPGGLRLCRAFLSRILSIPPPGEPSEIERPGRRARVPEPSGVVAVGGSFAARAAPEGDGGCGAGAGGVHGRRGSAGLRGGAAGPGTGGVAGACRGVRGRGFDGGHERVRGGERGGGCGEQHRAGGGLRRVVVGAGFAAGHGLAELGCEHRDRRVERRDGPGRAGDRPVPAGAGADGRDSGGPGRAGRAHKSGLAGQPAYGPGSGVAGESVAAALSGAVWATA